MKSCLVGRICIWIYYAIINMSGFRTKKHPTFKAVSNTLIENGIQSCTIQRKDQLKLILKESDAVVLVVEAQIQVEIE